MKVIFVISQFPPSPGGTERQAEILAEALHRMGIAVTVIASDEGLPTGHCDDCGFPVYRIRGRLMWHARKFYLGLKFFFKLVALHKEFEIIHVHQVSHLTFFAYIASRILGKPILAKVGNSGERFDLRRLTDQPVYGPIMTKILVSSHLLFIATTNFMQDELKSFGVKRKNICIIPNGVIVPGVKADSKQKVDRRTQKNICAIGTITEKKNHQNLIQACWLLKQKKLGFSVNIAGDGPLKTKLVLLSKKLGLGKNVTFLGQLSRDEVDRLIANSDIFVLPSFTEGLSNALLEAVVGGLVPVVSDIPSNREVLNSLGTNHFFDPHDAQDIANKLEFFLDDNYAQKMDYSSFGRFDIANVAKRYVILYKRILNP